MTEGAEVAKKSDKLHSKSKDKSSKRDKVKPLTKVVIRRLPPTMTEEEFLKQIDPIPDNEYYYYVQADWSLGFDATCRAYINFTNPDDIFLFKDRFDEYVFVDNKGAEYPAVVEFAPFQSLPRNKSRKRDPKANTIESDPHYLSFLEYLKVQESEAGKSDIKLEFSLQSKDEKKITSTPLLQYLANKKQERRDERKRKLEEKRRQRDEERQKKRTQIAKHVPPAIREEDPKVNKESAPIKIKERDRQEDNKKDAKAKRRAVRDLKRKQEREKRIGQDKKPEEDNVEKFVEKTDIKDNFTIKEDEKKREVKKYSQTRKSRNEFRKSDASTSLTTESKESSNPTNEKNVKESEEKSSDAATEISESVKEFIKSVASIKEFIPRSRAILTNTDLETSIKTLPTGKEVDMSQVREKLEQIATSEKSCEGSLDKSESKSEVKEPERKSVSQDISPESGARDSSCSGTEKNEKGKDKDGPSLRRIRNKDRPSIEIYQPGKLRLKKDDGKDGRSSAELKDYKSNPTSDCESVKKDKDEKECVRRKVSRYSERRSSRAKEKSVKDEKEEFTRILPDTSKPNETLETKEDSTPVENTDN